MRQPSRGSARGPAARPSDEKILAALRRAALHDPEHRDGATTAAVLAHLGIAPRAARARAVRAALAELERAGLAARARRGGIDRWRLHGAGRARLAAAVRGGAVPPLPESPQHRRWREARTVAAEELPRMAAGLAADLDRCRSLLAAIDGPPPPPCSDELLALAEDLRAGCRRLGSAWHVLHEWPEPDDARADRDEPPADAPLRALRAGRRNVRLWGRP